MNEPGTLLCQHCKTSIPADALHCPNCGAPAPEPDLLAAGAESQPEPDATKKEPETEEERPVQDDSDQGAVLPSGREISLKINWNRERFALVKQAASLLGVSLGDFIIGNVEKEAERIVKSREGMMDLSSAAEYLGTSRKKIIQMITEGELQAKKIEGDWYVDSESARTAITEDPGVQLDQIELDIKNLVEEAGLVGMIIDGADPDNLQTTWCYVNQEGILICPKSAWTKFGRERVVALVKDSIRRYMKRRDKEFGRF